MSNKDAIAILRTIELIDEAQSASELQEIFESVIAAYGFSTVLIGHTVNGASIAPKSRLLMTNWPDDLFAARRALGDTAVHDPVGQLALCTKHPFSWQDAYETARPLGRRLVEQARAFGLREGMAFPVHAYGSAPGVVSLGTDRLDLSRTETVSLDLIARHAYLRVEALNGPYPDRARVELTDREVEVVALAAIGMSNRQIAHDLAISPFTVRDYLRDAAIKLNTANRAHTVAVAITRSIICL